MEENNYLGKERVGKLLLQYAIPSTLAIGVPALRIIAARREFDKKVECLEQEEPSFREGQ